MWQKLLWNHDGGPRQEVIDALAMLLPEEDRNEFSTDLLQIMHDLEEDGLERALICQRLVQEVREAVRGDLDVPDEAWTDCESVDLISDTWD
ncbi:MAG: hypothetical protein D8M59_13110 [Planctomycetes bacterium]|nr:hypothetical protein [Planctomycetota bacterium]